MRQISGWPFTSIFISRKTSSFSTIANQMDAHHLAKLEAQQFDRMNPYASPTRKIQVTKKKDADISRRSRIAFWTTALLTPFLPPVFAIPIAYCIDVIYKPNMGTWVIPYFLFVIVFAIPAGILSALFARWTRRFVLQNPLLSLCAAVVTGVLPFLMIPPLKGADIDFWLQTLLLLFWTNTSPFFLGVTLYLTIRLGHPIDEGQWESPDYREL